MNELMITLLLIGGVWEGMKRFKKEGKQTDLIVSVLAIPFVFITGNFLQNHQAILSANSIEMFVAFAFSFIILTVLIGSPVLIWSLSQKNNY